MPINNFGFFRRFNRQNPQAKIEEKQFENASEKGQKEIEEFFDDIEKQHREKVHNAINFYYEKIRGSVQAEEKLIEFIKEGSSLDWIEIWHRQVLDMTKLLMPKQEILARELKNAAISRAAAEEKLKEFENALKTHKDIRFVKDMINRQLDKMALLLENYDKHVEDAIKLIESGQKESTESKAVIDVFEYQYHQMKVEIEKLKDLEAKLSKHPDLKRAVPDLERHVEEIREMLEPKKLMVSQLSMLYRPVFVTPMLDARKVKLHSYIKAAQELIKEFEQELITIEDIGTKERQRNRDMQGALNAVR